MLIYINIILDDNICINVIKMGICFIVKVKFEISKL